MEGRREITSKMDLTLPLLPDMTETQLPAGTKLVPAATDGGTYMDLETADGRRFRLELEKPEGAPRVFVIAGAGYGIPVFRRLQKDRVPFAAGVLFENDVDAAVAKSLAAECVTAPAFEPVGEALFEKAKALMLGCENVINAGTPIGSFNEYNGKLLELAAERGLLNVD